MKIERIHDWDVPPSSACELQRQLAGRIRFEDSLPSISTIAGVDISCNRYSPTLYAAVVVLKAPDWQVVDTSFAHAEATFPYRTGLLSFREAPVLLNALQSLKTEPDVVMLDGHGYSHPRRFGLACHIGLFLDKPCLGCAKSRLCGSHDPLPDRANASREIIHKGETIGLALRTKARCLPVYLSVGHKLNLDRCLAIVRSCTLGYRLPEPTRQAHIHVNKFRIHCLETARHK